MRSLKICLILAVAYMISSCSKEKSNPAPPPPTPPASFSFNTLKVNGSFNGFTYKGVNTGPVIKISFTAPVSQTSAGSSITFKNNSGTAVNFSTSYQNNDSSIVITPATLQPITQYTLNVSTGLQSAKGGNLQTAVTVNLTTAIDT